MIQWGGQVLSGDGAEKLLMLVRPAASDNTCSKKMVDFASSGRGMGFVFL